MSIQPSAGNTGSKWKQSWVKAHCKNSMLVYFESYPLLEITDSNRAPKAMLIGDS